MSRKKTLPDATLDSVHLRFIDQLGNPVTVEFDHGSTEEDRESASRILEKLGAPAATPVAMAQRVTPVSSLSNLNLSGLIEQYTEEKKLDRSWSIKTGEENASIYALLVELLGDVPVRSIDIHRAKFVRDTLLKLPPGIKKSPQYRGMNIPEILALKPTKSLNPLTIKKHLVRYSSLFEWAERLGYADRNPFVKLSPVRTKAENKERDRFSGSDLKQLFETALFASKPSVYVYRYWVPLIALFTGARLNEICQLSVADVRRDGSVWYFDINDEEEEKRLKTIAARRQVPLHSKLIDLGLLDYVESLKRQSEPRLFPELPFSKAGYGKKAGNWFNQQYRKSCRIASHEKKSFHSFRHTFVDELVKAGVEPKAVADMVGHHVSKTITLTRYTKSYSPTQLKIDLEKLVFDLELPPHSWA